MLGHTRSPLPAPFCGVDRAPTWSRCHQSRALIPLLCPRVLRASPASLAAACCPSPAGGVESHVCFLLAGPFRVLITDSCKEVLPGFWRSKVVSLLLCRIFTGNFTSRFAAEGDGPDGWGLCWLLSVFVLRVCCLVAFFFPEVLCPMVSQKQWTEGTVT